MRRLAIAALALLIAPIAARGEFRLEAPFVDHGQAYAIRAAAYLHCRQIRSDHGAGRSEDDCVMIDHRTMELRIGPAGDPESWIQHLETTWCEGNRYTSPENRFQLRSEFGCEQVCARSEEDRLCITKADIGRAARREPHAWKNLGAFRLVKRPRERAPVCTADEEHAEEWRVVMLEMGVAPGIWRPAVIPSFDDREITVQVVCPDRVEIPKGAHFRALAANGDACLPWRGDDFAPCLYRPEIFE